MSRVWAVCDVNGTTYYGTKAEADCSEVWASQPESVGPRDAVKECTRLAEKIHALEGEVISLAFAIAEFIGCHPNTVIESSAGRRLIDLMREYHPSVIESCYPDGV